MGAEAIATPATQTDGWVAIFLLFNDFQGLILVVAGIVTFWGVIVHRATARRRATLDFIINQESDGDLLEANKTFSELVKTGRLIEFAEFEKEGSEETHRIKTVLNQFEIASIGIQNGILDYEMYKRWCRGHVINTYERSATFIAEIRRRSGNDNLYCEFEYMYDCMKNGKKMKRRGILERAWRQLKKV